MDRRGFLLGAVAAGLVPALPALAETLDIPGEPGGWPKANRVRVVRIQDNLAPGQIHIVPRDFALYLIVAPGRALRYPVGIGKPGRYVPGRFRVGAKKAWPNWTPTPAMLAREPEIYSPYRGGIEGSLVNPLGARALYLYRPGGGDSLLRIHGTPDPAGIGREVSNGCARLVNAHAIDLYNRVPVGAPVVLHPKA